ncbi:unnamed protein product [Adineta steineri]|uniref:Uncharacterized protein n=1 Tax=Adineta steineri TaxID=433720 RepID=A0A814PY48_9BILA|nr:unnamed protein product [Adineta steineri]
MDGLVTTYKMKTRTNNCNQNCEQDDLCPQNCMDTSQKNLIESTALIHKKQKFNGKRWHKLCIINNCEKQVQRDDLCCRHFTEKRKQQKVAGNIGVIHMNQKFNGCRWQRVCSVDNCDKYAVKNGLCRRHTPRDAKKTQSSAKSKRERVNNNSIKNHTEHNTFDDLEDSQTIPSQQNSSIDSISAQFESPPDSIATELIAEIPSLNIDSGRKNCEEQLNYWIRIIVNKLQKQYKEFQVELDRLHNYIEMNKNQWKASLKDRMETQVRSILLAQLELNEIDGSELTKARDELLRAQKLCDLLNTQAIITTSTAKDNEIDLFTPRLCFSNVIVDGFNWIYEILPKPNAEIMKLDVALSKINNITTDPLVDTKTIEDNHFGDFDTSPFILNNTNQSMNSNNKQVDCSPIESTINNTNNSNNLSINIENQNSNSTSWLFQYHQNDLEQIITNPENHIELNLTSKNLNCSDMKIVSHYALQNNKEFIAEIPSLNIDSGRKNCEEQLNGWLQTTIDKIQQKYKELQVELDRLHNYIETNQDQWKTSLKDRMETKVRSVLTTQLKLREIDGSELTKARDELLRAQKLYNLLNSQTMITVSNAKDNEIDLLSPRLAFSNVIVDGFTSIDKIIPKTNAEIIEQLNEQAIDLMNNETDNVLLSNIDQIASDLLINTESIEDIHFMDTNICQLVLDNTNQSMNNNTEQADFSVIESIINNTNNSDNLSTNIEIRESDLISWFFQDHQSDLEQIITNPENRMELNLTSKNLSCSDMKIVSHYALQNNKTLIQLDLSRNQIKDIGACHLSIGLQLNQTLTILDLSHNQIGDTGISELSVGLKSNKILTTLDLSDNQIKNEGARFLSAILKLNTVNIEYFFVFCFILSALL